MADVQIIRIFNTSPERLYDVVTQQAEILNWWGYDDMDVPSYSIDLTRTGPWHYEMYAKDGTRYKHSGQVTKVTRPSAVSFTWGWHDDQDNRGAESHVTFSIDDLGDGRARLTIDHRDLADGAIADRHEEGWTRGPLPRLERYVASLDA